MQPAVSTTTFEQENRPLPVDGAAHLSSPALCGLFGSSAPLEDGTPAEGSEAVTNESPGLFGNSSPGLFGKSPLFGSLLTTSVSSPLYNPPQPAPVDGSANELTFSPSGFLCPPSGPPLLDEGTVPLKAANSTASPAMLSISPFMHTEDQSLPVAAVAATPPVGTVGWADYEPTTIGFALPPPTVQQGYTVRSLQSSSSTQQSGCLQASVGSSSIVFA